MPAADDRMLERIARRVGVPDIAGLLAERLPASDLQSLLLAVARRRAARIRPADLLQRYENDRFAHPSALRPAVLRDLERRAEEALPAGFETLALSPVAPLGSVAALTTVDQNSVLSTMRGSEVVSDPTNVLALECALRRRRLLTSEPGSRALVRLAAGHRTLRAQVWDDPAFSQHFALFGLCSAGRDEGSARFEAESLVEHAAFYLRLLGGLADLGIEPRALRVAITPIGERLGPALQDAVVARLAAEHPQAAITVDRERTRALGYYETACLSVSIEAPSGEVGELADGGFTSWTQQLLANRKERLLISGIGLERLAALVP